MDDFGDAVLVQRLRHQIAVAGRAGDEGNGTGDQKAEAGGQVIEHDSPLARVDERMHHVAADITGTAGHQDCHDRAPEWRPHRLLLWLWPSALTNRYGGGAARPV